MGNQSKSQSEPRTRGALANRVLRENLARQYGKRFAGEILPSRAATLVRRNRLFKYMSYNEVLKLMQRTLLERSKAIEDLRADTEYVRYTGPVRYYIHYHENHEVHQSKANVPLDEVPPVASEHPNGTNPDDGQSSQVAVLTHGLPRVPKVELNVLRESSEADTNNI